MVFGSGINLLDTSASYGSERQIGDVIHKIGGIPDDFVLASKADPDPATGAFDGPAVRRSLERSLALLGVDKLKLYLLHDPERISFEKGMAKGGPVETMLALRDEHLVDHIGVAGGPIELMRRYIRTGAFSVVLTHNRYSLVNRAAEPLIAEATELNIGVINAAPFGGGVLARGLARWQKYAYNEVGHRTSESIRSLEALAARYDLPLKAVALQFSMRDPRISTTLVGVTKPERVTELLELARREVPEELWIEAERLVPPSSEWLT
jgi:D-threo-aldose 1-dehydrogenase